MRDRFRRFAAGLVPGRPVAVLCHSDADGLAAGAILARALRRAGHAVAVEVTGKGEDAWRSAVADRLARHAPQALLVADLGSRDRPVLGGVPTLLIDHHRPDGVPPGATLITGYGREPTPTSGLLAYRAAGAIAEVDDLLWIAAVSLLSDLGDDAPFAELEEARRRYKITPLREATSLLNAPAAPPRATPRRPCGCCWRPTAPAPSPGGTRPRRRPCGRPRPRRAPRSPRPSGWRRWSSGRWR